MEMRQGQRRFPIFSVVKVLIAAYLVTMVILLVLAGLLYKLELSEGTVIPIPVKFYGKTVQDLLNP